MIIKKYFTLLFVITLVFNNIQTIVYALEVENPPIFNISTSPSFPLTQNISAGARNVKIAEYNLSATSHVMINNVSFVIRQDPSHFSRISNLKIIVDGVPTDKIIETPEAISFNDSLVKYNNFDSFLSFEAGDTKHIEVFADVNSTPNAGSKIKIEFGALGTSSGRLNLITSDKGTTTTVVSSSCNISPSITLISPNGGEVYTYNKKVEIKWSTCSIPISSIITFYLEVYDNNNQKINHIGLGSSINNGSMVTNMNVLPNTSYGKHFRVSIDATDGVYSLVNSPDYSDDLFSINPENSKPATFTRTLKIGMKGDDVKALQSYLGIKADGVYGRGTASKVKEWQLAHGLKADGLFGAQSQQKINSDDIINPTQPKFGCYNGKCVNPE